MKTTRRILAMVLCLVLALSLAVPALAAGEKYQYQIYQIFTGDYDDAAHVLTNVKWGEDSTHTAGEAVPESVLEALEAVANAVTDAEKLAVIKPHANLEQANTPYATHATNDTSFSISVPDGYYLVKDASGSQDSYGSSYTTYIVKVVNGILSVNRKGDNIIPDKKIESDDYLDNNGSDDSVTADGKTNNVGLGNKVNYELSVKIPVNADGYSYYYCVLNDTLSKGLTFDASSVVVKVDGTTLTAGTDYILYTGDQTTRYDHDGIASTDKIHYTFQIAMLNAKSLAGKTIVATYSATLNKDAVVGVEGNPNEFTVTYSNDPNYDYADTNNNGRPDVADDVPIGETPVIETFTYTTGLKLIKVDEQGNVLTGAEFTLSGDGIKYVLVSQDSFHPATSSNPGEFYRLINGTGDADDTYTTTAPRTAVDYIEAPAGATAGYVLIDGAYVEYDDTNPAHAGQKIYLQRQPNDHLYLKNADSTFAMYYKETVFHVRGDDVNELPALLPVAHDGTVYATNLGEGVYTITETKAPAGYNKIDPITVTIDWTAPMDPALNPNCTWQVSAAFGTSGSQNLTMNSEGVFELTVENRAGSNLPETGGIGTTLFYVFGGIMVLGAAVLLITKKRMLTAE